jgi:hypothetical protein
MVSAFGSGLASFLAGQNTGRGREVTQALRRLAGVAQQGDQFLKSFRRLLGAKEDLPPLFKPVRRGMAIGQPAVDVFERDAQQRRIALDLVRH